MDVETMRQIGQDILALPARFNMNRWFEKVLDKDDALRVCHSADHLPHCGTVCCFAGEWAIRSGRTMGLSDDELEDFVPEEACWAALSLPNYHLFHTWEWPYRLRVGLNAFKAGTPEYAAYFVNVVLENYIATNGWEDDDAEE